MKDFFRLLATVTVASVLAVPIGWATVYAIEEYPDHIILALPTALILVCAGSIIIMPVIDRIWK